MAKHLLTEIDHLKKRILALGKFVEEHVQKSVISIGTHDVEMAKKVIKEDTLIDKHEIDIEEDCLKILALHQPVAIDLRFIIAVLKINTDLERVGDLAVNIAERTLFLATKEKINVPFDFPSMAKKAQTMLKMSLDSLVNLDVELASKVCELDDEVDKMNREMYEKVNECIRKDPQHLESLVHLLSISRHLERIADHATNIAEDVIYMIEGVVVRHRVEDFKFLTQRAKGK